MSSWVNFFKYNNTVPLVVSFLLLSFSGALAASPEARDLAAGAVFSSEQETISIDNTYLVSKNLDAFTPTVRITGVTEDSEVYYVTYSLSTIGVEDYVWKDLTKQEVLEVSKVDLGTTRDLGLFVTAQMRQLIAGEQASLVEAKKIAQQRVSARVVATTYGGLIGAFLDDSTETLPGYVPVVTPPEPVVETPSSESEDTTPSASEPTVETPSAPTVSSGSSNINLQIMGNNPAEVPLNASYVDLGVYVSDPNATNVGYKTYVNGAEQVSPNIDTSVRATHTIEYRLIDRDGNTVSTTRTVIVGGGAEVQSASSTPAQE